MLQKKTTLNTRSKKNVMACLSDGEKKRDESGQSENVLENLAPFGSYDGLWSSETGEPFP